MTMKQLISQLVEVKIGDTVVDLETPMALPPIEVDVWPWSGQGGHDQVPFFHFKIWEKS